MASAGVGPDLNAHTLKNPVSQLRRLWGNIRVIGALAHRCAGCSVGIHIALAAVAAPHRPASIRPRHSVRPLLSVMIWPYLG